MADFPIDTAFTPFVNYPGTPNTPGAADLNRWSNGIKNLANPPSAKWQATNNQLFTTSPLTLQPIKFDTQVWQTDDGMTVDNTSGAVGTAKYSTDRILLPYPGIWEVASHCKTQTNNSVGVGYMTLSLLFNDGSGETEIDWAKCDNNVVVASFLATRTHVKISAAQVTKQICVRVRYAQNSGGTNAVVSQDPSTPFLFAEWKGLGT